MNKNLKYPFLTKEVLEKDYEELKSFKLIADKYGVYPSVIQRYCKIIHKIKTKPKAYEVDHNSFSEETEESFYWAGFIAADGCVVNGKRKNKKPYLVIGLSEKDETHLKKFKNFLKFAGPIKKRLSNHSKYNKTWKDVITVSLSIYSTTIINDLKKFGIGPRKSLTYKFPKHLSNHKYINHFMRGYNDGDGSFYYTAKYYNTKKNGKIYFKVINFALRGTLKFLKEYKKILVKHGLISISKPKFNNGIGKLGFTGTNSVKHISKFLYNGASVYLDRKFHIIKDLL